MQVKKEKVDMDKKDQEKMFGHKIKCYCMCMCLE
jgi:hypothetical protein